MHATEFLAIAGHMCDGVLRAAGYPPWALSSFDVCYARVHKDTEECRGIFEPHLQAPPHTTLNMAVKPLALWVLAAIALFGGVHAQPSPDVQKRISAAIKEAGQSNSTNVDYTQFVNVFIGTDNFGDVWCASRFSYPHVCSAKRSPSMSCQAPERLCPLAWCVMHILAFRQGNLISNRLN